MIKLPRGFSLEEIHGGGSGAMKVTSLTVKERSGSKLLSEVLQIWGDKDKSALLDLSHRVKPELTSVFYHSPYSCRWLL